MRSRLAALALVVCGAAPAALADRTITVDGNNADWNGVTSCFAEGTGDGVNGVDISRSCLENDNTSGSNGYLYLLFETVSARPSNAPLYLGVYLDKNNDGLVNTGDETFTLYFKKGSDNKPVTLNVTDPVTGATLRTYATEADCGGGPGENGWYSYGSQKTVEARIAFGCLGITSSFTSIQLQTGAYPGGDVTDLAFYDPNNGTFVVSSPPPDVSGFSAVARNGTVRLEWVNPSAHEGVLVVRSTAGVPNFVPTKGTGYAVGQTLGNGSAVYVDQGSSAVSAWADTGLANGTRYYYRVFNHHQRWTYSAGNAPSSQGLWATPTSQAAGTPVSCVSYGMPSTQQPIVEKNVAVYTAHNGGALVSQATSTDLASTGNRRWPAVQLQAAVGNRPTVVPFADGSTALVTGDQSGRAYAVNASTGALKWTANGGNPLGDRIQAQPAAQLYAYANAAFQSANPGRDLVFFATRNNNSGSNKVVAVSSANGATVWTFQPQGLDIISGGMMVDYANNRLWVTSRNNSSVRVVNTLTGTQVASFNAGASDHAPIFQFYGSQAYVVNNNGTAYGYDTTALTQAWTVSLGGAPSSWLFPTNDGFVVALTTGVVKRYTVSGATVTQVWSTAVPGPSGAYILYGSGQVYVGSSNGRLYQLAYADGAVQASPQVSGSQLGMPVIDNLVSPARILVGGLDGRVCALALPLP